MDYANRLICSSFSSCSSNVFVSKIDTSGVEGGDASNAGITAYYDDKGAPVSEEEYWNSADKDGTPTYKSETLSLTDSVAYLKTQEQAAPTKKPKKLSKNK